jgi:23S rRNA (adenine2503-C2)-methyltransferase
VDDLVLSLDATTDELRWKLIPSSRGTKISDLLDVCRELLHKGLDIRIAYLMLKGINDREDDLVRLRKLVDKEFTIELAEFNPFEGCDFEPSEHIEHFANSLENEGFNVIVLHSKGKDIEGACGQLRSRQVRSD